MRLYNILNEIEYISDNMIDTETGEINEEMFDRLEQLQIDKETVIENIALEIKNQVAYANALKVEKQSIADKQAKAQAKADRLKEFLTAALGGEKFKTGKVDVSYRKSQQIDFCGDIDSLPADCIDIKKSIKKTEIKKHLKAGEQLEGVSVTENINTIIK